MIVSTGGATLEDVDRALDAVAPAQPGGLPAPVHRRLPRGRRGARARRDRDLPRALSRARDRALRPPGRDRDVARRVHARRARVEKHFTLSHAAKGTDHAFSLMPEGMRKLVRDLERVPAAIGDGVKRPLPSEAKPLEKMGKKLVAARALPAGSRARGRRPRREVAGRRRACRRTSSTGCSGGRCVRDLAEDETLLAEDVAPADAASRAGSPPRRRDPAARRRAPRDRARRLRLRRRLHRQPRLGERDAARSPSRAGAATGSACGGSTRWACPTSSSRPSRTPSSPGARRSCGARCVHGVDDKLARRSRRGGGRRRLRSSASPMSATTSTTRRASRRSGLPVVPADAWPEVVPLAGGCSSGRAGTAACASSATPCGARCAEPPRLSVREVAPPVGRSSTTVVWTGRSASWRRSTKPMPASRTSRSPETLGIRALSPLVSITLWVTSSSRLTQIYSTLPALIPTLLEGWRQGYDIVHTRKLTTRGLGLFRCVPDAGRLSRDQSRRRSWTSFPRDRISV